MPRWGVIPSIRVGDMAQALLLSTLGWVEFLTLDSGGEGATNSSLNARRRTPDDRNCG